MLQQSLNGSYVTHRTVHEAHIYTTLILIYFAYIGPDKDPGM